MTSRAHPDLSDDRIAVLLPGRPSEELSLLLRTYDVGLIFREGDKFTEELF